MTGHEETMIRVAEAGDATAIHAALRAMAAGRGAADKLTSSLDDIREQGFGADPAFEALIAEVDGRFAGLCLTFPIFSTWRGERGVFVQDLYVDDEFRGRRIGEALIRAAASRGRARGARYLRLSVDTDNVRAQGFYERLGIGHGRDEQVHMATGAAFAALASTPDA